MSAKALAILRRLAEDLLKVPKDTLDPDADLLAAGLDSLRLFRLSTALRKAGYQIAPDELHFGATLSGLASAARPVAPDNPPVAPAPGAAPAELQPIQAAYLAGRRGGGPFASGAHHYFEFDGAVEPSPLERAVSRIVMRHPSLRLRISPDGRQSVATEARAGIAVHDLRRLGTVERTLRLEALRRDGCTRPMDIVHGECLSVGLAQLPGGMSRTMIKVDMIACDAAGFRVLVTDLAAALHGDSASGSVTAVFPPQTARTADPKRAARWKARLEDVALAPSLPARDTDCDGPQPMIRRTAFLDAADRQRLERLCRTAGLTPTALCAAFYCDVLAEFSAEEDFVVILPVTGGDESGTAVGNRTRALPLVWRGSSGLSARQAAQACFATLLGDIADADYTTAALWRDLAADGRAPGGRAVFTSMLGLGDLVPESVTASLGTVAFVASETPDVGIDLQLYEEAEGIRIIVEAREVYVSADCLNAILERFRTRIGDALDDPESLNARPGRETRILRGAARAVSDDRLEDALLRRGRGAQADAAALIDMQGRTLLRYDALLDRAMRISGGLAARGVVPGDHVALAVSDTSGEVAAVCGCLLAGAVYVPLRADAPPAVISGMARLAEPRLCIVDERSDVVFEGLRGGGVDLAPLHALAEAAPAIAERGGNQARAYVLFTSGSTGAPKAVAVSHRAALNTIDALCEMPGLDATDGLLGLSDLTFDLSVFDIFAAQRSGARLARVPREDRGNPGVWVGAVTSGRLSVWQSAPQFLELALCRPEPGLATLRHVLLGGDVVRPDLLRPLRESASPGVRLWALGGATEAAIHSTLHEITDADEPSPAPFGGPLPNVSLRVVDRSGRDRSTGIPGELWIGGASLAEGYLGDPERSAQRFGDSDGERWYRTGDAAAIDTRGCVRFLGRLDRRVKIAGQLVDLAGIEKTLSTIPGVLGAVADHAKGSGLRVALRSARPEQELAAEIPRRLPRVLRPARILCLDAFPVTPNGKIHRAAISDRLRTDPVRDARDAAEAGKDGDETRAIVLDLAGAVLGRQISDAAALFYALGGNSLQAIDLLRRLEARGLAAEGALELIATAPLGALAAAIRPAHTEIAPVALDGGLTQVQEAYFLGRGDSFDFGGLAPLWYWEFETGTVDIVALARAMDALVARHPCLRRQVAADGKSVSDLPPGAVRTAGMELHEADTPDRLRRSVMEKLGADMAPPHLCAGVLRGLESDRIGIAFDIMFLDARGIAAAMQELGAAYRGRPMPHPPRVPAPVLSAMDRDAARRRWQTRLNRLPSRPDLPVRATDPPRFSRRGLKVAREGWDQLQALAAGLAVTPTVLIATIYADILLRWSDEPALALNVTLFDAPAEGEDTLGERTRLVPLFVHAQEDTLAERARALSRELAAAVDGAAYGSIDLVRDMTRSVGNGQALLPFVLTSTLGLDIGRVLDASGLGRYAGGLSQTPQTWIDCQMMEVSDGLCINWDVLESAFPEGLADAMFAGFETLLQGILRAPHGLHRHRGPALAGRTLSAAARPALPGPGLHSPVFTRAAEVPDAPALLPEGGPPIRYGALAARALALGARLRAAGVEPGTRVGLLSARREDQIAGALGALAAGLTYVPLNPSWPRVRLHSILETARIPLVLGDASHTGHIGAARCLGFDETGTDRLEGPHVPRPDESAYVIFTSGTTGAAKGVTMTHGAARNTIDAVRRDLRIGAEDCLLAISPFDFDLSVFDIFGVLGAGGRLALPRDGDRPTPGAWSAALDLLDVTLWNSAPSLFGMVLDAAPAGSAAPLRHVLLSGDRIPPDFPARVSRWAPGAVLTALGGATEAGIWSNAWRGTALPDGWAAVPYGQPLDGQSHRVMASDGTVQPEWAPGELWIGGTSLSQGYENDPDLSAAAFPVAEGQRWYRTGDRARIRSDGLIEFLGRIDPGMGKVNGVRVDCEEVGSALSALPGIEESLALVDPGPPARLLGFVRPEPGAHADPAALRRALEETLPASHIPSRIATIDEWPVTLNGKLDRAALRAVADSSEGAAATPWRPAGEVAHWVAETWSRLLRTDARAGRSFLEDGGDSLLALEMTEAVERAFGLKLPLRAVFFHARAEDLAREIETNRARHSAEMEAGEL